MENSQQQQKTILEQLNFGTIEHNFEIDIKKSALTNLVIAVFFIFLLYFTIKYIFSKL
jgi:hypothetical protein